jgi:hypothetical protein
MSLGTIMNDTLQSQKVRLEQIFQELVSINECINKFKDDIEGLSKKCGDLESLKGLEAKVEDATKGYVQGHAVLKRRADQLDSAHAGLVISDRNIDASIRSISFAHQDHMKEFQEYKKVQDDKFQTFFKDNKKAMDALRFEFQASINKMQNDLVVSPSTILQQNNDVMKKLESTSLDGTNAVMKVNNLDTHVRILEKRIENLAIQIKRLELSKTE